jgi:short-subunit dehydrogenase
MQVSQFGAGLAEALRSELILYEIDVHCFFPCTIYTPGYEEENKTKPKVTLKIEEADSGLTPEQVAAGILKGACLLPPSAYHILKAVNRRAKWSTPVSSRFNHKYISCFHPRSIAVEQYLS